MIGVIEVIEFVLLTTEVREQHFSNIIAVAFKRQLQLHIVTVTAITLFNVPLTANFVGGFLWGFTPAITDRSVRRDQLTRGGVKRNGLPLGIIFLAQIVGQIRGAQESALHQTLIRLIQANQIREVGGGTNIVVEIFTGAVNVKLFQDHVTHGHGHRRISTLFGGDPFVGQFCHFGVIWRYRNGFGAFIANFGEEMRIRCTGLRNVRTPRDNVT